MKYPVAFLALALSLPVTAQTLYASTPAADTGRELLYNGIRLPAKWPPKQDIRSMEPIEIPYLKDVPAVIPVDLGRQLFFDDFLIAQTTLERTFHKPQKYEGNPILKPETELEINAVRTAPYHQGVRGSAVAAPKSGGVWWDADDQLFKMWYEAGWLGTIALATSRDGLVWERPNLDIVPGTNQVLPGDIVPDSWSVVRNWDSDEADAKWTLYLQPPGASQTGWALTSPDGIHWERRAQTGITGDRSTHHYNPFRKKWVFSLRGGYRLEDEPFRIRRYYESDSFTENVAWDVKERIDWLRPDKNDPVDAVTQRVPQLYNFDAVAYESIMLGFFQIYHGPKNQDAYKTGIPKITELMFAYSRDGYHWDRPDRRAHIEASRTDVWDRGYVQSIGNICVIQGDTLFIYYTGFQGDTSKADRHWTSNGIYDRGATGVAFLRRDGFASMDAAGKAGTLTTRPLSFSGSNLFVNVDAPEGILRAEVRDAEGNVIAPFSLENSVAFRGDSTLAELRWNGAEDLSALADKSIVLHFELVNGSLYSFWISKDASGRSDGYLAGGGPGYAEATDTVGRAALDGFSSNPAQ